MSDKIVEVGKYSVNSDGELKYEPASESQGVIFRDIKQKSFFEDYDRVNYGKFTIVDDALYRDCNNLSDSATKIFLTMCGYMDYITCYAKNINGKYVDDEQLARVTNRSVRTVKRGIKELIDSGFIAKSEDINGLKCYVINPFYTKRNSKKMNDFYLKSSVMLFSIR